MAKAGKRGIGGMEESKDRRGAEWTSLGGRKLNCVNEGNK